jgi:DNA-directed RNA polymerase II subunit RPB2
MASSASTAARSDAEDARHRLDGWAALGAAFRDDPYLITRHQLDSYDRFVGDGLARTLRDMKTISLVKEDDSGRRVTAEVFIGRRAVSVDVPTVAVNAAAGGRDVGAGAAGGGDVGAPTVRPMYPNDARLRDLTYGVNVYADVEVEYRDDAGALIGGAPVAFERPVRLGLLPLMLHSRYCVLRGLSPAALREVGECPDDRGGYFVVDGKEKVIVAQEDILNNRPYVRRGEASKPEIAWLSYIRSDSETDRFPRTTTFYVRSRDAPTRPGAVTVVVTHLGQVRTGSAGGNSLRGDIPLFVLFRALGVESDRAIMEHVVYDVDAPDVQDVIEFLRPSAAHAASLGVRDQRAALRRLAAHVPPGDDLKQVLVKDLFPNMSADFRAKALFLGHVVAETARVALGKAPASDSDDFTNKRLHVSGFLLGDLFRDTFLRVRGEITGRLNGEWTSGAWRATGDVRRFVNLANLGALFESERMSDVLRASMKGRWGPDGADADGGDAEDRDAGVVQDLTRISLLSYVSHVRRVNHKLPAGAKLDEPRKVRASQWGALCVVESPDGGNIGLLNHLAVLARISMDGDAAAARAAVAATGLATPLARYYERGGSSSSSSSSRAIASLRGVCKVMVNDTWTDVTHDPPALVAALRAARRAGTLDREASVAWSIVEGVLHVHVDRGRFLRPLAVVPPGAGEDGAAGMRGAPRPAAPPLPLSARLAGAGAGGEGVSWASLFEPPSPGGLPALELVDVEELRTLMVAMRPSDVLASAERRSAMGERYTHCELQPGAALLSLSACTIPLVQHNKGPRNVFALAQFKQAIGTYSTAFAARMDTHAYVLHSPQRPLVSTAFADRWLCRGHAFANGENVVVAVLTYTGYNMEDAIMINRDAVERGRLNITCFETHRFQESVSDEATTLIANPLQRVAEGDDVQGLKAGAPGAPDPYRALGPDGLPTPGAHVGEDDVLLGRVEVTRVAAAPANAGKGKGAGNAGAAGALTTDRSVLGGKKHRGVVDAVAAFDSFSAGGARVRTCKVRMREQRPPEMGDKLASRYAQKGVIGLMLPACDMPFCASSGVVPDLVINPHGFPSRDTFSHLVECVLGKAGALAGRSYHCNPLEREFDAVAEARGSLERLGLCGAADEVMVNGRTGEQIGCDVFVGVNYYGRLKHMVADKVQARSRGRVNAIVRQPAKSGGRSGGMRIGEMEQNAVVAHGMSHFLKESFVERSDGHLLALDADEGTPARARGLAHPGAGVDGGPPRFADVQVPYALKLLGQELATMAIDAVLEVEGRSERGDESGDDDDDAAGRDGRDEDDAAADAAAAEDDMDAAPDVDFEDLQEQVMDNE